MSRVRTGNNTVDDGQTHGVGSDADRDADETVLEMSKRVSAMP